MVLYTIIVGISCSGIAYHEILSNSISGSVGETEVITSSGLNVAKILHHQMFALLLITAFTPVFLFYRIVTKL